MAVVTYGDYLTFIGQTELDNASQVKQSLESAEDYANKYCNRTFARYDSDDEAATKLEEPFSGGGTRKYFPKQAPIVSVTLIEYWDAGADDWTQFDTGSYTPNATADRVTFREGQKFTEGNDNLRLTYVYGYTTVPASLIRAICLIAQANANTAVVASNLKKQFDGEQTFEYFENPSTTVPAEANELLDLYVRNASA